MEIIHYENQLRAMWHRVESTLSLSYPKFFCFILKIICRENPLWINFCSIVTLRDATKAVSLVYRLRAMQNGLRAMWHSADFFL
jgi:hypothetical protein